MRGFRGSVVLWTGDTLGSNLISGFKEGVGGALRLCRHCMGTREETNEKFHSSEFQERSLDSHVAYSTMIDDQSNSANVHARLSTTYGINGLSVLQSIRYFNVCQCFPEDIMHILFEGIVPYETKLALKYLIDDRRCFTLKQFNELVESFSFGYMNEKSRPSPLNRDPQFSSQMWCLFRYLPLILGDKVEEGLEHWHCLIKLWNIVQICTSPKIHVDDVAYLRVLIDEHHRFFKRVYLEASIIPKLHYLVHIPDEILRFGPPRNVWTMRFEAKHSYFKKIVSKIFKNISKTLAFRHQRNMCWNLLTTPGQTRTSYLYKGDEVGPGDCNIDLNQHIYAELLAHAAAMQTRPERFFGNIVK